MALLNPTVPFVAPQNQGMLPALAAKLAATVTQIFGGSTASPYLHRQIGLAAERTQLTREMPKELAGVLPLPEDIQVPSSKVRFARYADMGVDARFSFGVDLPSADGKTHRVLAKQLMPLFDGADHSFRPGMKPPVLLSIAGEVTSVAKLALEIGKSPKLLAGFPKTDVAASNIEELSLRDLVQQNTQNRNFVSWALVAVNPARFDVVKADGTLALLDRQDQTVTPSIMLEKGWDVARLSRGPNGMVMAPDQDLMTSLSEDIEREKSAPEISEPAPMVTRKPMEMDI